MDSLFLLSNEFLSDEPLLREIQRRAVRFFWQEADPATGLVKDRAGNFDEDQYTAASIAATGYGLAALPIGITNRWLSRLEAAERARKTLRFLLSMPHEKGWMWHFVDKQDGARLWNSEYSSIDTGILLCGAIACAQFFHDDPSATDIGDYTRHLYERIDWCWMLTNGGSSPDKSVLSHGWTAEKGFLPYNYDFYSEAILLVLAGLGAPINPLPEIAWAAINRPKAAYQNYEFIEAAPIFIHQMPMGYFNLANQRDVLGYDYWVSSTNAMKVHRQYCMDNAAKSRTYAGGYWGLNASDGPDGYVAYGAPGGPDDGTISPTGAISSIPFLPDAAVAISNALFERLGKNLWGRYGFSNALNLDRNWFDRDVIGIDLGMVLLAIENFKTGLVWDLMRSHESIRRGLQAAGFRSTTEPEPRALHEEQNHQRIKT